MFSAVSTKSAWAACARSQNSRTAPAAVAPGSVIAPCQPPITGNESGATGTTVNAGAALMFDTNVDITNQALTLAAIANLNLSGGNGADSFQVTPSATAINIAGSAGAADSLSMNLNGASGATLTDTTGANGHTGTWTFSNRAAVNYAGIETLNGLKVVTSQPVSVKSGSTFTVTVQMQDAAIEVE